MLKKKENRKRHLLAEIPVKIRKEKSLYPLLHFKNELGKNEEVVFFLCKLHCMLKHTFHWNTVNFTTPPQKKVCFL